MVQLLTPSQVGKKGKIVKSLKINCLYHTYAILSMAIQLLSWLDINRYNCVSNSVSSSASSYGLGSFTGYSTWFMSDRIKFLEISEVMTDIGRCQEWFQHVCHTKWGLEFRARGDRGKPSLPASKQDKNWIWSLLINSTFIHQSHERCWVVATVVYPVRSGCQKRGFALCSLTPAAAEAIEPRLGSSLRWTLYDHVFLGL